MKWYEMISSMRKAQNMTQHELSEKVGYSSRTMISMIENGLVDPPHTKVEQILRILGYRIVFEKEG